MNDVILSSLVTVTLIALVSVCAVTDILTRRIPNPLLVAGLAVALLCHTCASDPSNILSCLLGLGLGVGLLMPFYALGGIGAGDVKLMGVVGALLGAQGVVVAGIATFVFGGVFGLGLIVWRMLEAARRSSVGDGMRLERIPASNAGGAAIHPSLNDSSFPYGPAIAAGTYFTIWQTGLLGPALG